MCIYECSVCVYRLVYVYGIYVNICLYTNYIVFNVNNKNIIVKRIGA